MSDALLNLLDSKSASEARPTVWSAKVLTNEAKRKLLAYQHPDVLRMVNILVPKRVCLNASDTGTGKTYTASAVCKELSRRPYILCPKTLIPNWHSVLEYFGIKHYDIVNYETIRNGKTYVDTRCRSRKKAMYLKKVDHDPNNHNKHRYEWTVPSDAIVIFDEAHRCKDPSTENGRLLVSTKQLIDQGIPVLLLSATICEKITDMKIPFYLFGFIESTRQFKSYVLSLKSKYPNHRIRRGDYKSKIAYETAKDNLQSIIIYEEIKHLTSRLRIKDLGDSFPKNQWCAQQFMAEGADEISAAYKQIAVLMKALSENPGQNHLAKIQKLKQEIEFRKVPIFIEQAQLHLDDGKSVIIFVNYLDSLRLISEELSIKCQIHGSQTVEERQEAITNFQTNAEPIIICQIRAGGVGIGLHDLSGDHPRVVLMNYPDCASDLLQALGRAPRAGAKSPVLQRIIFVANVEYERKIMININKKLSNISAINDGDLDSYKYDIKKITRRSRKTKPVEV